MSRGVLLKRFLQRGVKTQGGKGEFPKNGIFEGILGFFQKYGILYGGMV
jgi:hypothetical protein